MGKYDCWYCEGEGKIKIHSVEGKYAQGCGVCGGSGKKNITITVEEYENLKEKASMYDDLCRWNTDLKLERSKIMSENSDEIARLEKQLDKAIEILGSSSIDACPMHYGLNAECPEHNDCQRCWEEALSSIE